MRFLPESGRLLALGAVLAAGSLALASCGGDDAPTTASDNAAGGEAKTVKVAVIGDFTGVAGALGSEYRKGVEYAIEQANQDGTVTLEPEFFDTGTLPAKAASEASKATSSDASVAIFGVTSGSAQALAPIVQKAGLPTVLVQSGAPGLPETGDRIFRVTAPITGYQDLAIKYLQEHGKKSLATVYTSDNAASSTIATETLPDLASTAGIEMGSEIAIKLADTDFTAIASKLAGEKPDAIYGGMLGSQYAALIQQLKRSGWSGTFIGHNGIAYGVLPALGDAGEGVLFTSDFSAGTDQPQGKAFAEGFKSATGADANLFNASGNDAVALLVAAAEGAAGTSRDDMTAGLAKATEAGIEGAVGPITFEGRDARVPGMLVEWSGGAEKVVLP